jgi:D-amino peptidase
MVGYHSKAQTRGILAHTINSFAFRSVSVNGTELGEAGLYGALAGQYGVPVALLSGDDVFLQETLPLFPGALGIQTKQAQGMTTCTSLSPALACERIREQARLAIQAVPGLRPFTLGSGPYTCTLITQTVEQADLFCQWPQLERVGPSTVQFQGTDMAFVLRVLNSLSAMTFMLR